MRFNVLVVGERKSGKSTLISALLRKYLSCSLSATEPAVVPHEGCGVKATGVINLKSECDVHLFESHGFGDQINNAETVQRIQEFLAEGHRKWNSMDFNKLTEQGMKEADDRIHCVFYLMSPHKVTSLDLQFLEEICCLVPIVPVVSKADSMTFSERKQCLLEVNRQIQKIAAKTGKPVIFDFREEGDGFLVDSGCAADENAHPLSASAAERESPVSTEDTAHYDPADNHYGCVSSGSTQSFDARTAHSDEELPYGVDYLAMGESYLIERTIGTAGCTEPLPMVANIFAVICATDQEGERVYPWGAVRIDDEGCSDFRRLQRLLVESGHISAMVEFTYRVSIRIAEEEAAATAAAAAAAAAAATVSAAEVAAPVTSVAVTAAPVTCVVGEMAAAALIDSAVGVWNSAVAPRFQINTATLTENHKRLMVRRIVHGLKVLLIVACVLVLVATARRCLLRLVSASAPALAASAGVPPTAAAAALTAAVADN